MPRRERMLLGAFTVIVLAWMLVQALTGAETGLLYLAPALVLALPLIGGRYVGEQQLAAAAERRIAPVVRAAKSAAATRSFVRVMQRGSRLVASSLAKRPPPVPLITTS